MLLREWLRPCLPKPRPQGPRPCRPSPRPPETPPSAQSSPHPRRFPHSPPETPAPVCRGPAPLHHLCPSPVLVLLVVLRARFRQRSRGKSLLRGLQDDDLRDNILNYNEQGGGEEDQVGGQRGREGARSPGPKVAGAALGGSPGRPGSGSPHRPGPSCDLCPQDAYDINQLRHPSELTALSFPQGGPPLRREAPFGRGRPRPLRAPPTSPADIASFIRDVGARGSARRRARTRVRTPGLWGSLGRVKWGLQWDPGGPPRMSGLCRGGLNSVCNLELRRPSLRPWVCRSRNGEGHRHTDVRVVGGYPGGPRGGAHRTPQPQASGRYRSGLGARDRGR